MSDGDIRDYSLTVRLAPAEKAALHALAERYDLDKSALVRKALRMASGIQSALPPAGCFVPLPANTLAFSVRLRRKDADG